MREADPRVLCVEALRAWERGDSFADEILHRFLEDKRLGMADRALLNELFYGVLRNLSELDFLISQLRSSGVDKLTRQILRTGLYQIFHMRVPDHAAVNETVNLSEKARPVVNAVLRRSLREKSELEQKLLAAPLPIRLSHPEHLVTRWTRNFGREAAEALCCWNNQPAEIYVRANQLKVTPGELLRSSSDSQPCPQHAAVLKVTRIPFAWVMRGLCYVQDPSTLPGCELLDPQPGQRILDACAAPGGKASYLAELMQNSGEIVACDVSKPRLERLNQNLRRLGIENVTVVAHDWLRSDKPFTTEQLQPASFDRILVDAPCSNTGVMRRRIDVRWRITEDDFERMQARQVSLLTMIAPLLRKGGVLVYSTCSLEPEENDQLVEIAQRKFPFLRFLESRQTLPFRDGVDGAYAAKFVRN